METSPIDATGWVQIIAACGGVAVLIMNTWATMQTKQLVSAVKDDAERVADDQGKALSVIHENGNAHLALMTNKLAESEKRNEQLITEANSRIERAFSESASRIENLEKLLAVKREEPAPSLAPVAVQIEQPLAPPVPVTLPVETPRP